MVLAGSNGNASVARVKGVRVAGLASSVPQARRSWTDQIPVFGEESARKVSQSVGVEQRHVVGESQCTSDLCAAAAERLIQELGWQRDTIDLLVFVSQTPDYILPATSCVLHGRLGLSKQCATFDVNLGCSGYVYGLWLMSTLLAGGARRGLLLVGDTISRTVSPEDRSTAFLFGDAGTATALEADSDAPPMIFCLGTDGTGMDKLMIPAGGFRHRATETTNKRSPQPDGNIRSQEDLYLDGGEIFAFTLKEVPPLVQSILKEANWAPDEVEAFVFHQANRFMLEHLAKRMKLPLDKVALNIESYGNTSSASIPLTITDRLGSRLKQKSMKLILAGFGVGYSWAGASVTLGPMAILDIILLDSSQDTRVAEAAR